MKKTIIILLTILALGCNAQEPRLMFSVNYVDSLNQKILNQSIEIAVKDYLIDSSFNEIIAKDSIILDLKTKSETLQACYDAWDYKEISVIADTFNFEIVDDRIKVEVMKIGHNVGIYLVDSDTIISATYYDYIRNVILSE